MSKLLAMEIENYRSFYTRQELSFGTEEPQSVTALFGVNSGGKSNTARALVLLQGFIRDSASANWTLPYDPFLLKEGSDKEPTYFKLLFEHHGRYFTYEFGYDSQQIVFEELKERSENSKKMKVIFSRDHQGAMSLSAKKYGFGASITKKTRKETLLVTKAREDNNEYANIVFDVVDSFLVIMGDSPETSNFAIDIFKKTPEMQEKTLALMKKCDFNIRGFEMREAPIPAEFFESIPFTEEAKAQIFSGGMTAIKTSHAIRDEEKTVVGEREFDFFAQESMGTRKFFDMAAPVVLALEIGRTLYIDEFGAFLNPTLATAIVEIFKGEENVNGANLILNTHNTSIMSDANLSREEIILVEKTLGEESRITPLSEKSVRENESFEKRYRSGLYGGIPVVRDRA